MLRLALFRLALASALALALLPAGQGRADPQVDERFQEYYRQYDGMRVLGYPLTELVEVAGYPAQYFEKGRLEDHRGEPVAAGWALMYGRLAAELIEQDAAASVSGTSLSYADLRHAADPLYRHAPPNSLRGGTAPAHDGVFVPYDSQLRPAPGYYIAPFFWAYINRPELFPGGWLHDVGLPLADVQQATALKQGELRTIIIQAFERAILTYDAHNPAGWQVERANIGSDALGALPGLAGPIEVPAANAAVTLPLHVLARVGQPGATVTATLRWQDGAEVAQSVPVLRGEHGRGLVFGNLSWPGQDWQLPASQSATLELRDAAGALLARQQIWVLNYADPEVREVTLYWVQGNNVWPMLQHIPRATRLADATLDALLWGPPQPNPSGFITALPTPERVLASPLRAPDWGPRATLRSLTIIDGVASADFSQELAAYRDNAQLRSLAHEQIAHTLKQFAGVQQVRILIDGRIDATVYP